MKNNTTKFNPAKTYTRDLGISTRWTRNVSVSLRPAQISPAPGVWIDGFEISASHENFTGAEWIPIHNKSDAFTFSAAVKEAKAMVDCFMEDAILESEVDNCFA